MSENYLVHHGISGMKWGKRNGPPYPLNESDKSAAEKKASHNVSAKDVHKNMDRMTDAELQKAINRINMQNQVANLDKNIIERGYNKTLKQAKEFVELVATATAVVAAAKKVAGVFNK